MLEQTPSASPGLWTGAQCTRALPRNLPLLDTFECLKHQGLPFQALLGSHKV